MVNAFVRASCDVRGTAVELTDRRVVAVALVLHDAGPTAIPIAGFVRLAPPGAWITLRAFPVRIWTLSADLVYQTEQQKNGQQSVFSHAPTIADSLTVVSRLAGLVMTHGVSKASVARLRVGLRGGGVGEAAELLS